VSIFSHGPVVSDSIILDQPTSDTGELIKPALQIAARIYEPGKFYKKAGVMLGAIVPETTLQGNLFISPSKNCSKILMCTIDNINFSMRDDILKFAITGNERNWKMRQEFRSPRYTSRWNELRLVS